MLDNLLGNQEGAFVWLIAIALATLIAVVIVVLSSHSSKSHQPVQSLENYKISFESIPSEVEFNKKLRKKRKEARDYIKDKLSLYMVISKQGNGRQKR